MTNKPSAGNMKHNRTVNNVFQDLLHNIQQENKVKTISENFSNINSNSDRVLYVYGLLEKYQLFPEFIRDEKNDEMAVKYREKGNQKFKEKKLQEAMELYTKSLAQAKTNSENISKALANRSAVLFELEMYEHCLRDIQAALDNNYPQDLQPKLNKRRENALVRRKSNQQILNYFNKIPEISEHLKSSSIQCASNALEIQNSESQGRHIVATRNIEIGEILAIERPFCNILVSEFYTHCHECLKLCYNLLPCLNCSQALYCNKECQKNAAKYHKYECNVLKTLRALQLDKMKLLPLKIVFLIKDDYDKVEQNMQLVTDVYRSDRYKEIHNLVTNTSDRSVADLFERSTIAAVILNIIKTNTDFFTKNFEKEEKTFRELILLHFQTAPCNFHEISELSRTEDGYFETQEIGAGAFSFMSLFNHSCNPNIVRHCYGDAVVIRAIKSIEKGEQCCDNYGYHFALMSKIDRQNNLKKQYFFDCACTVCKEDWPLLHDLPIIKFDTNVTDEDISDLRKGNDECVENIIQKLLPKIKELEKLQLNRLFPEMQEVLKQCFALLGNVKRF